MGGLKLCLHTYKKYKALTVYIKKLKEAGRGWWGDAQKYWFREDVASELALD